MAGVGPPSPHVWTTLWRTAAAGVGQRPEALERQGIPLGPTDSGTCGPGPEKARKTVKNGLWISA
jgi:hypothetical protein